MTRFVRLIPTLLASCVAIPLMMLFMPVPF